MEVEAAAWSRRRQQCRGVGWGDRSLASCVGVIIEEAMADDGVGESRRRQRVRLGSGYTWPYLGPGPA